MLNTDSARPRPAGRCGSESGRVVKLVTYRLLSGQPEEKLGALSSDESEIIDLQAACQALNGEPSAYFKDMIAFVSGGSAAREQAAELVSKARPDAKLSVSDVKLLAPLRPRVMRDTMCFEGHLINCRKTSMRMQGQDPDSVDPEELKPGELWYTRPLYYKVNVNSIIGTDEEVTYPEGEQFKDYELELAVVIGKEGKNINARDAMDYVAGYTIFNDFSARTTQVLDMGDPKLNLGPGVSKDFANGLGPCMVTADAFDFRDARAIVRVNGEVRSEGNHGTIDHDFGDVIAHASNNVTLYPGDIICTGTITNCSGFDIGRPVRVDDVIELEIEGIGVLRHKVVAPKAQKMRNRHGTYKRSVCAVGPSGSHFAIKGDYPDVWRMSEQIADTWRVDEIPATASATMARDMGNLPVEHEPPKGGSILRHVGVDQSSMPVLKDVPEAMRPEVIARITEMHKIIGTHSLPTPEELEKHPTMHKTDTLNLFFCSQSDGFVSLNEREDIPLEPGDTLIQVGCMHGWRGKGVISGILVSADMSTLAQLTEKPASASSSGLRKFRRYVAGTMKSDRKESGESDVLINDYSPNAAELRDADGDLLGYAGDIWKTSSQQADISCKEDVITEPMADRPAKGGVTFRMIELLPGKRLNTNPDILNYYCVVSGELSAHSENGAAIARDMEDIIQLPGAALTLENTGSTPLTMAHFMTDADKT